MGFGGCGVAFVLSFAMVCTLLAGVNVVAFAADDNDLVEGVHSVYNDAEKGGDGEHLYTTDHGEISWLVSLGTWNDEEIAWNAPVSSSTAIWRCYNPYSGEHLYVPEGYADYLAGLKWNKEKVAFYSDDNEGTPVYRLWNGLDGVGSHYFTTDYAYALWLVDTYGWKIEDVAFYGVKEEEKSMTAAQTGANEITVAAVEGEFTGLETFTVSHGDVADELAGIEYDELEEAFTITLANDIEDATYTVTCSDTDFAAVTFEGTSELEILELEATGSKELTATLNRAAELDADDVIVKKGNVTLTPADVTCIGDTVVITLGSKIVKDTYSVTIENSTASVETEDEKLVEFKTVGTNIAKIDNDTFNPAGYSGNGPAVKTGSQLVAASIEYQALNQYGDPVSAEILQMTNTFGGATVWTEPTAKKNGEIVIYNVPSTLGIQGTEGNLIVVSKSGVSSTCPVTMSEEAKVAMVTPLGIYDNSKETFVEAIPADTTVAGRFGLVVDVRDQYGRPMYAKGLDEQTCTAAQTLTNVTCKAAVVGKFDADDEQSIADAEMMGQKITVIPLLAKSGAVINPNAKAIAGSVRLIAVGDRFGTVMDTTVDVANVDLIESFNFTAKDTIYNRYENELDFEAISVSGEEITDYEALSKLVKFDKTTMEWKRNQDGSAKLVYKPAETFTNADNMKETTVTSVTATCNEDYSKTDLKVVPKTFTVSEDRQAYSVVKYTGDTATANTGMQIDVKKLVIEDQYGNTLSNTETAFTTAILDWQYGTNTDAEYQAATSGAINVLGGKTFATTGAGIKLWVSVSPYARDNKTQINTFNTDKAQLQLTIKKVDSKKVTNLKAEWNPTWNMAGIAAGTAGPQAMVKVNPYQVYSGVTEGMIKVTGTVGGQTITLDPSQYSIKTDTYVPITAEEQETAVKVGMVTMTVQLVDSDNKEYTEDVTAMYQYSAAPSAIAGIVNAAELQQNPYYPIPEATVTGGLVSANLRAMFVISTSMEIQQDYKHLMVRKMHLHMR